jgi:8-oxo-(d)GTP phosphatase
LTTDIIRAAGAVVWRGHPRDPEVALVRRDRYDDWTFPKGKLKRGEHLIAAALREVREETGLTVRLGRALPPAHYVAHGRPKRVDYWSAQVADERPFEPDAEVSELAWLPVGAARARLTYPWDGALLDALAAEPLETVPLVLIRHGSAGSRHHWDGDDGLRPLDADGRAQAETIARVLPAYRPERLLSSPSRRCVQTLEPYSAQIVTDPLLSEEHWDPDRTTALVERLTTAAAVCSHGKVLPQLISVLAGAELPLRKGAFAVLHRLDGRTVGVEPY